jgi:hypothetical protein
MGSWPNQLFTWLAHGIYRASPTAVADGSAVQLLADSIGKLCVRVVGGPILAGYHRTTTPAIQASVKASSGAVVACWGFNKAATAMYVQLHNKATSVANNDVPTEQFLVPAGQPFSFQPPEPIAFSTGIQWAVSTTPGPCTLGSTDVGITVAYQ